MHYIIIILTIISIAVLQVIMFINTLRKIRIFESIFPDSPSYIRKEEALKAIDNLSESDLKRRLIQEHQKVEDYITVSPSPSAVSLTKELRVFERNKALSFLKGRIKGEIISNHSNETLVTIITAINDYLVSNKNAVCDFHLMKDIVERNCDAQEQDFQTQVPIPLYFGLGGTMLGILIGVGFFVFDGGLSTLLNSTSQSEPTSSGIETLLGGVAIAMFASFLGIVFTTIGSYVAKTSKSEVENNKHTFLTWVQVKLLPNLSADTSSALVKMSQNLRSFNETFLLNTGELGKTLSKVNESYGMQKKLWDSVKELADKDIQQLNLELFKALKDSIREIEVMGEYLRGINQHQSNMTDSIEKMQKFFSLGIEQVDSINIGLKNALSRFSESSQTYISNLQEKLDSQLLNINDSSLKQQQLVQQRFEELFGVLKTALKLQQDELLSHLQTVSTQIQTSATEQGETLKLKLSELTALVDELQNLSSIRDSVKELVKQTTLQSQQNSQLVKAINEFAEVKINGGVVEQKIPKWLKFYTIFGGSIVIITCLSLLALKILSIFGVFK